MSYRSAEQMQALEGKVGHDVQVLIFGQKVDLLWVRGEARSGRVSLQVWQGMAATTEEGYEPGGKSHPTTHSRSSRERFTTTTARSDCVGHHGFERKEESSGKKRKRGEKGIGYDPDHDFPVRGGWSRANDGSEEVLAWEGET